MLDESGTGASSTRPFRMALLCWQFPQVIQLICASKFCRAELTSSKSGKAHFVHHAQADSRSSLILRFRFGLSGNRSTFSQLGSRSTSDRNQHEIPRRYLRGLTLRDFYSFRALHARRLALSRGSYSISTWNIVPGR